MMLETERDLHQAIDKLPLVAGIYALLDLDCVPMYISYASESVRIQVRHQLTGPLSNVEFRLAVDPWEVGSVWIWSTADLTPDQVSQLEQYFKYQYGATGELAVRPSSTPVSSPEFEVPKRIIFQLLSENQIQRRRQSDRRLAKQARHFARLVYWCSEKRYLELFEICEVHFRRLNRLYDSLRRSVDK